MYQNTLLIKSQSFYMESKELSASYTKGEWYLQEYTDAYTNIIRCNKGKGFETIFIGYTGQGSSPDNRANARLMAAAPDLLESLQGIIAITDRDHVAWAKAKAAIDKALMSKAGEKLNGCKEKEVIKVVFHNNSDAFRNWVTVVKGYEIDRLEHSTGVRLPDGITLSMFESEWEKYEKLNNPH
jgi:hypothetical protein